MNTQALKCIPFVILAIFGTFYVGMGPAKNMVVGMIQFLCWVIFIVHVPFLMFVAAYHFARWQFAYAERERANAAMINVGVVSLWTSSKFLNALGWLGFSLLIVVLVTMAKHGLQNWIYAQGGYKILRLKFWVVFNWLQLAGALGMMFSICLMYEPLRDIRKKKTRRKSKKSNPLRGLGDDDDR